MDTECKRIEPSSGGPLSGLDCSSNTAKCKLGERKVSVCRPSRPTGQGLIDVCDTTSAAFGNHFYV